MVEKDLYKKAALLGYLVKTMKEKKQVAIVGKTYIQKLTYLLTLNSVTDFEYTLYHYGPYSFEANNELNFAKDIGILNIDWNSDKGFNIFPGPEKDRYESLLTEDEKTKINEISDRYINFSAKQLSIVATAKFLEKNMQLSEKKTLVEMIGIIKPNLERNEIEDALKKDGLI